MERKPPRGPTVRFNSINRWKHAPPSRVNMPNLVTVGQTIYAVFHKKTPR